MLGYDVPIWEEHAFGYRCAISLYCRCTYVLSCTPCNHPFYIFLLKQYSFFRPEGDSCLNADLCRAALLEELRLLEQSLAAEREIQGEGAVSDTTRAAVEVLRLQVQQVRVDILVAAVSFMPNCNISASFFIVHSIFFPQIHSTRHSSTEEAVAHAIQDLHSLSTTSPSSFSVHGDSAHSGDRAYQKKGVVFVDLTCPAGGEKDDDHSEHSRGSSLMMRDGEEDEFDRGSYSGGGCCDDGDDTDGAGGDGSGGDVDGEEGQRRDRRREPPLSPLQQVDRMAQQLYQAAPEGTLLVIVTQGSMQAMRLLASKKTRYIIGFIFSPCIFLELLTQC